REARRRNGARYASRNSTERASLRRKQARTLDREPICRGYKAVVIKICKLPAPISEIAQAQRNLHSGLDGREINGWTILIPRPLYVSASSSALVMTPVPGQSIGLCTVGSEVARDALVDAARTLVMAMEQYWSTGQRHGDLNFGNILFDLKTRRMSAIDGGVRADCRVCSDTAKISSPAVADLGHLLWETAYYLILIDLVRSQPVESCGGSTDCILKKSSRTPWVATWSYSIRRIFHHRENC